MTFDPKLATQLAQAAMAEDLKYTESNYGHDALVLMHRSVARDLARQLQAACERVASLEFQLAEEQRLGVTRLQAQMDIGRERDRLSAKVQELEREVERLNECLAVADADRVPLAMDVEILRERVASLERDLRLACNIGMSYGDDIDWKDMRRLQSIRMSVCDTALSSTEDRCVCGFNLNYRDSAFRNMHKAECPGAGGGK